MDRLKCIEIINLQVTSVPTFRQTVIFVNKLIRLYEWFYKVQYFSSLINIIIYILRHSAHAVITNSSIYTKI